MWKFKRRGQVLQVLLYARYAIREEEKAQSQRKRPRTFVMSAKPQIEENSRKHSPQCKIH